MKRGLGIPILMMMFSVIWAPNLINNKKNYNIKFKQKQKWQNYISIKKGEI